VNLCGFILVIWWSIIWLKYWIQDIPQTEEKRYGPTNHVFIYWHVFRLAYIGFDHRQNEEDVYTTRRANQYNANLVVVDNTCSKGRGGQENDGCSDHQVWLGPQASDRSMGQLMKLQARTDHPQHLWPCMLAKDELQKPIPSSCIWSVRTFIFSATFRVPTKASNASIWQAKELRKLQAFDPCSGIPRSSSKGVSYLGPVWHRFTKNIISCCELFFSSNNFTSEAPFYALTKEWRGEAKRTSFSQRSLSHFPFSYVHEI